MAPTKKGSKKKKGQSAINNVVTGEHTTDMHKRSRGADFKKRAPGALKQTQKSATKAAGAPDVRPDTRLNEAAGPEE